MAVKADKAIWNNSAFSSNLLVVTEHSFAETLISLKLFVEIEVIA